MASMPSKYWYSVPTAMPARSATTVVVKLSTPSSATMRSDASRMASTLALLRCCWGVRRDVAVGMGGSAPLGDVLHLVQHVEHDLADEGPRLVRRPAGHAAIDRTGQRLLV